MAANVELAGRLEDEQLPRTIQLVKKRDGRESPFDAEKIEIAIQKAFLAEASEAAGQTELTPEISQSIKKVVAAVISQLVQKERAKGALFVEVGIEEIQDAVEQQLMRFGHYSVARRYIIYRQDRARARALREEKVEPESEAELFITNLDKTTQKLDWSELRDELYKSCDGYDQCSASALIDEVSRSIYNFITPEDLDRAKIFAARTKIELDPAYARVASRLLLSVIYKQVLGTDYASKDLATVYREKFKSYISKGVSAGRLSGELRLYNLEKIAAALTPERDNLFVYMGLQTIYDRYLLHVEGTRIETPQYFWMRVAMGLGLAEKENREEWVVKFYNVLSTFRFVSSTPTLFNSGTPHPQLSSCYLSTTKDDLAHIFKVISDNAMLSKWAGGLGNDWTSVRATGARIKGTNGESQGVIPFLKVANDTAVAVNQGGKRKGAMCAYLETWHLEVEEFLELRKNTGDERRRTHDMNTANWIPDLFMKRVRDNGTWTLFSPNDVPELHDIYGKEFERRYLAYEAMAEDGQIKLFKQIPAVQLWRKMLSMLFETGHPWITFKDPSNIRSPQDHMGVVHSSNLCTEILLNTSEAETAVCNLGSVNLIAHMNEKGLNEELLKDTVTIAVRMLDNVIDINYYPTAEARNSNLKHRPVGLGIMGFQDALYTLRCSYDSEQAVEFADRSMEVISYYAILASTELARERGAYLTYKGSKWDRGLLPIDTIAVLRNERGGFVDVDMSMTKNWDLVRKAVKAHGMRNSNVMAIAPTATIANIVGINQSIEPIYRNLYVKSNLSGEFTVINPYLVTDLKKLGLWDAEMIDDLKYFDGELGQIERIPDELKDLYKTAFSVEGRWLIECASRRQKWIDMGQSLNLYMGVPNGKQLHDMYMLAWERGLKTTYYLRSLGATQIEKSTMDINRRGIQPRWMKSKSASSEIQVEREPEIGTEVDEVLTATPALVCDPNNPDCESCQ